MSRNSLLRILIAVIIVAGIWFINSRNSDNKIGSDEPVQLDILWSSGEAEVFNKVVYIYGLNSMKQGWWDQVEIIIWGPSARLLADKKELHQKISALNDAGVRLTACKWCTDQYDVSDILSGLGVEVKYMGEALSSYLKKNHKVLVF